MKAWQHILFWILVYASLTLVVASWFGGHLEAFYYVSMLMPVVMGTSYFFNFFLVPRYLFRRRFGLFLLYSLYMLVVSLCLELVVSASAMLVIIAFGVNENGALITDIYLLAGILYFIVLIKSFLLLLRHYFVDQRAILTLEEKQSLLEKGYFTVRTNRQQSKVYFEELLYIESLADYIRIHLENGTQLSSREKISHVEKELPDLFLRIHRSFIVNREKITSFSREAVMIGETELPVSRTYRQGVISELS